MATKGHVLGGGAYSQNGQIHYALAVVDLAHPSADPLRIPISFLAHDVIFDPLAPHRVALFEKRGPGACIVDLRERRVLQQIPTLGTRQFYGHGAYAADGSLLYATESYLDRALAGAIVVRDTQTFQELGELQTYGKSPHDCKIVDDGKVIIIAHGGGPYGSPDLGNLTWIELSSGKLLEQIPIPDERFNAGHLAIANGDLAVVSAPRDKLPTNSPQLGAVSLRPKGKPLRIMKQPPQAISRMLGESLSVLIDESRRIAIVTHPLGDAVTVWNFHNNSLIELLEVPGPRGIAQTLDSDTYLISHLLSGVPQLTEISASTYRPTGLRVQPSYLSGSHIFVRDLNALLRTPSPPNPMPMLDEAQTPLQQLQWYRESIHLQNQMIVDVGANIGTISEFFWIAGNGTSSLLSIEPLATNVEKIQERIRRHATTTWKVECCAISDKDGEVSLRREEIAEGCWNSTVSTNENGTLRVPCRRLSTLAPEATIVKLDIEGHEYKVLAEAVHRMQQVHTWAIEFHGAPEEPLEHALGQLVAAGFQLVAAGRRISDPSKAWMSTPIPASLSWNDIPTARNHHGRPFQMLHVLAQRKPTRSAVAR